MKAESGEARRLRRAGARAVSLAVAVLVVGIAFVAFGSPPARAYTPQSYNGAVIEPNPEMEGNTTFSTHLAGWNPLEYSASSGQGNLSAATDPRVPTPFSINPGGIVAPGILQNDKVSGTTPWNQTSYLGNMGGMSAGGTSTETAPTVNGQTALQWVVNTSNGAGQGLVSTTSAISSASWPSSNPTFDYVTAIMTVSGGSCATCSASLELGNASVAYQSVYVSSTGQPVNGAVAGATAWKLGVGSSGIVSFSLAQETYSGIGLNYTGKGATASLTLTIAISLAKQASTSITVQLRGLAFGTAPLTLGNSVWGTNPGTYARASYTGNANLTALNPSFAYSSVSGGSYTVALVQRASDLPSGNVSLTESALSNGSEQVSYNFAFGLPIAPGLTYGAFKLVDVPRLAAWQYIAVNFGGSSYLSTYQTKTNIGNYTTVIASVAPTTGQSWVGTIVYTEAQWIGISSTPGLFTTGWFAFNFWWIVGGFAGLMGIGGTVAFAQRRGAASRVR
ncbi:MAG TPA: hypothetical protein VGU43_04540 [Thermoplasmata archaeon]|nr:hypothetical protein [Thermoplasmata archaeon]